MKEVMEMRKLDFFDNWPSPAKTWPLFIVSLILAVFFNVVTFRQLDQSQYPDPELLGPFPAFWFTFSGPELKSHYAILLDQGTMDTFIRMQYLDYGLMISTGLFFFMLAVVVARRHQLGSFWRRFGFITALILVASSLMDVFENATLLVMLSNPLKFPDWLAIVYSSFATAKVSLVSIVFVCWILTLIALVVSRLAT